MASNPQAPGNSTPPKPWERAGTSSGPAPFKPPSSGSTSEVVESSRTAKPGEVAGPQRIATVNTSSLGRSLPPRPWQQNYGTGYGGYGSSMYGSYGGLGGSYGGLGGSYGGGLYGNSMYNTGYGGLYGGSGMYGSSMYNGGFGGHGMGVGGPSGNQNPNNPHGPPSPPGFWISLVRVMHGVVNCFGRISILVNQNAHAFHMFMTALLQLFERSGLLYGELARFVLRILRIRRRPKKQQQLGSSEVPGTDGHGQRRIEAPKVPTGSWESIWSDDVKGAS